MTKVEEELIRDQFIIVNSNDKLRADLLHHRKKDGSILMGCDKESEGIGGISSSENVRD